MVRVSNFKNLVILHFAKGNRYLPMREDEFNDLIAMHESIMGQIKKCKKVIHTIYKKLDSDEEKQFTSILSRVKICKLTDSKKKEEKIRERLQKQMKRMTVQTKK